MCSVSHGPSMMESEPEEGLSWVSEGNSRAGQPDRGNLHFKEEGAMLNTKEWIPCGEISGHKGRYFHAGDSGLMCSLTLWNQVFTL